MLYKCYFLKSFLEKTSNIRIILISTADPTYRGGSLFNFKLIVDNVMKQFVHDF